MPEEAKFAQLYANKRSTDTSIPKVLFSSYSLLEEDPILKIQGTASKSNLDDKNMQLLMTYEGNKFGYTYQGVGKGEHNTVSVSYVSDIPNKISFSAPKWIKTDYQEVTADDWNHLSYSFIQNIPFYSDNDISNMK